jgi:hypothetical protein
MHQYFFAVCFGCYLLLMLFLACRFLSPWWWRRYVPPKLGSYKSHMVWHLHSHCHENLESYILIFLLQFDPKKAQALSKQLPQLDFTQATDVDALETSSWMMGTKVIKRTVARVESSPGSKPGWDIDNSMCSKPYWFNALSLQWYYRVVYGQCRASNRIMQTVN